MYENFFKFKTKPFELVPNPDFLYLSGSHRKVMTYLNYGIREKYGFILVTGEVGSGKTTLIRTLLKGMDRGITHASIFNTRVDADELIAMINDDFGLESGGKNKIECLRDLNDFLIGQYAQGLRSVLVIDEAQNLTPSVLEEIRMLSNLETDNTKLLHIILIGQPELRRMLSLPELRQLQQRINLSCHIAPLSRAETEDYIRHRLAVAGNKDAVRFQEEVFDVVHSYSRGIPRLINIICEFLLLVAFSEKTKHITKEMVKEIAGELEKEGQSWADSSQNPTGTGNNGHYREMYTRIERIEHEIKRWMQATTEQDTHVMGMLKTLEAVVRQMYRASGDISLFADKYREGFDEMKAMRQKMDQLAHVIHAMKDNK